MNTRDIIELKISSDKKKLEIFICSLTGHDYSFHQPLSVDKDMLDGIIELLTQLRKNWLE
jgi:hypothetical protein